MVLQDTVEGIINVVDTAEVMIRVSGTGDELWVVSRERTLLHAGRVERIVVADPRKDATIEQQRQEIEQLQNELGGLHRLLKQAMQSIQAKVTA